MSALQTKSSHLFERFAEKLGKIHLDSSVAIPAAIGVAALLAPEIVAPLAGAVEIAEGVGAVSEIAEGLAATKGARALAHGIPAIGKGLRSGLGKKILDFVADTKPGLNLTTINTAANLVGSTIESLAHGFHSVKSALNDTLHAIRKHGRSQEPENREPAQDGRSAQASKREHAPVDGESQRHPSRTPSEPAASRAGTAEMIARLALAHRINATVIVIENNEVREVNTRSGDRPICKMDSVYWTMLEQETRTLHQFADKHQLDADALYVRDGAVHEKNPHASEDRMVCQVKSEEWTEVRREMIVQAMEILSHADRAPSVTPAALPHNDDIACALATLGEDVTVTRIDEVRAQMSAIRLTQPNQTPVDLIAEVDAARRAADQPQAADRTERPYAHRDIDLAAVDDSFAPSA
ncbi:hypothetical protein FAZ69_08355 [Trinickia terrae]|uniref:Uncharacterized protein n=1 Tax=Trinickia terrae TaxID=2571161 RepID=A0A4V5PJ62_9BURK|nr:hypothetical protein [Trinickia terrae]TKC90150.1 hypothetical protein FAZ69_08355 [Trinickia terrae]